MPHNFFSHFFKRYSALILILLLSISIPSSYAYSQESTGLSLTSNQQNNGMFVKLNDFYIFATDKKIIFYTIENNGAVLKKTWDIPFTGTVQGSPLTQIINYDSANILVESVYSWKVDSYYYNRLDCFILNVNTLSSVTLIGQNVDTSGYGTSVYTGTKGICIFKASNGYIYTMWSSMSTGGTPLDHTYFVRLTPSYLLIGKVSGQRLINGPICYRLSQTDSNIVYFISNNENGGSRYKIFKLNFISYAITEIGLSPMDYDYGSYVYQVAHSYNNVSGIFYYHILIAFPSLSVNKEIRMNLIRFNDTYINEDVSPVSVASSVDILRPFTTILAFGSSPSNLINGFYDYVFAGPNYYMYSFKFKVNNLEGSFELSAEGPNIVKYQDKIHYYIYSSNIGGLQDPYSNVGIYIDYTNNKCIADTFSASSINWTYERQVWDATNQIFLVSGKYTIKQNINYKYKGWLKANNVSDVQGYFKIYRGKTSPPTELWKTGLIFNSYLEVNFIESEIGTIYWLVKLYPTNYQVSGESLDYSHEFFVISTTIPTVPPGGVPDVGPSIDYSTGIFTTLFVPFMLMLAPALILASFLGTAGLVIGLIFGVTLTAWCGVIPLWVVVISIFGIFVALILIDRRRD